jgi:hypothetical protein
VRAAAARLRTWWPVPIAALLGTALVLARGRPSTDSDAGIFLSVAARLLDGDRLYVDVWDNKDPLFFWTYAAALGSGDWRAPFLLDAVWLALAGAGAWYLVRALGTSAFVATLGLVSYPVLLTGAYYYAGYSMLPALALAPVAAWLWLRGQLVSAGAIVAVAALYKSNLTPVVASGPVALALLGLPRGKRLEAVVRGAAGFAGVLVVAAAVLALRGELGPYLRTLRDNVSYAGDVLTATDRPTGLYGHVWSAAGVTQHTRLIALLVVAGLAFAGWTLVRRRPADPMSTLSAVFAAAVVGTAITLAATAVWDHHAQVIAYPGFLLVCLAAAAAQELQPRLAAALTIAATAVVVTAFGGFSRPHGLDEGSSWRSAGGSDTALALEASVGRGFVYTTYAVLGENHEEGHAAFLHGEWVLACPRFHQYTYSRHLGEVVRCLAQRRPILVAVDPPFGPAPGQPRWNAFVEQARRVLRTAYLRLPDASRDGVEVWRLR